MTATRTPQSGVHAQARTCTTKNQTASRPTRRLRLAASALVERDEPTSERGRILASVVRGVRRRYAAAWTFSRWARCSASSVSRAARRTARSLLIEVSRGTHGNRSSKRVKGLGWSSPSPRHCRLPRDAKVS